MKWNDDPRLLAYALGDLTTLTPDDVRELEASLASDESCRAALAELRAFLPEIEGALAAERGAAPLGMGAQARDRIVAEARGGRMAPRAASRVRRWVPLAAAAGLVVTAGMATLVLRAGRFGPDMAVGREQSVTASLEAPRTAAVEGRDGAGVAPRLRTRTVVAGTQGRGLGAAETRSSVRPESVRPGSVRLEEDGDLDVDREGRTLPEEPSVVENPFIDVAQDPLSTFSIDVDTASYSNARRAIMAGVLPRPDQVRVEEFVNYFSYADAAPGAGDEHPFSVNVQVGAAPWRPEHRLVRIALKGRPIDLRERPQTNLVFLVDVSGSMNAPDKLPLVKRALAILTESLRLDDRVAIVVYASAQGLALESTTMAGREAVLQSLERLGAGGSTNGGAGIQLAYAVAREHFVEGGVNRVILCTDGDFNVGVTATGELEELIAEKAADGIDLTVLGFGGGNFQDGKMEALSNRGNGNFAFIDSELEARKALVAEVGGTLQTIARDVKIQVAWNPREVVAFRLLGYENRMLTHAEFTDDRKDAGEIGAGHGVTALYEVVPMGVPSPFLGSRVASDVRSGGVRSGGGGEPAPLLFDGPDLPSPGPTAPEPLPGEGLVEVRLRYKPPTSSTSVEFRALGRDGGASFDVAPLDLRFAASVAAYAMHLRGSESLGSVNLQDVRRWAVEALGPDPGGLREAFIGLIERTQEVEPEVEGEPK